MGKLDKPRWAESPEIAEAAKIAKQEARKKRKQAKLDEAVTRIQPAAVLRERVREIRMAPHGPLANAGFGGSASGASIIPKWAACPHCAGALEVAKCKPATQKNFDDGPQIQGFATLGSLAGLLGGGVEKKQEEEEEEAGVKKKKVGLPDVEVNSDADTEERLYAERDEYARQLTQLQEEFNKLDDKNEKLQEETDKATKEMEELQEKLLIAEGSEKLWRDKYATANIDRVNAEEARDAAQAAQAEAEAERDRMREERDGFKARLDRVTRRKGLQLDGLQQHLGVLHAAAAARPPLLLWRTFSTWQKEVRVLRAGQEEMASQLELATTECAAAKERLGAEQAEVARLRQSRIDCGVRLLERKFPTHVRAYVKAAWHGWTRAHPVIVRENEIARLQEITESSASTIAAQAERIAALEAGVAQLETELRAAREERDAAQSELKASTARYEQQLADERVAHQFQLGALEERRVRDVKRTAREVREQAQEEIDAMAMRLEDLEGLIDEMERKADATRGPGQKRQQGVRVVPRNKGIVCVSCLRQLLVRDVKPVQRKELERVASSPHKIREAVAEQRASTAGGAKRGTLPALNPRYPEEVEKRRFKFFESELNGVLDPGDPLHQLMWSAHADPYDGLAGKLKGLGGRPQTVGLDRAQSPDWVREWK